MARNAKLTDILFTMVEVEQARSERIAAALERTANPTPITRSSSVDDFCRLHPTVFTNEENPLAAEKWLVDTENLLAAARIIKEEKVQVVKIQFSGIARSWWLMKEVCLPRTISWGSFSELF